MNSILMNWKILYILVTTCYLTRAENFHFPNVKPITNPDVQLKAAKDVIKRIIPEKAHYFNLIITDPKLHRENFDTFQLVKKEYKIEIIGNSGVSLVWGFHHYIKNYCGCHIGWKVKQLNLPDDLPEVNITIAAKDRFRYYQNVCTTSYSFVWWNKDEWQKHIDWMALNGINLALAPHGQEAIWQRVYEHFNLTTQEIQNHFSGPAFLSWQRMGNIRHWGGPLSIEWQQHTLRLQKFVVEAMNNLGITPALPAFSGFVPRPFERIFPHAKFSIVGKWNKFESDNCCPLFIEPTDPLFNQIGTYFLTEVTKEFGYSHVYYSDSFNEISPTSNDIGFLKEVAYNIYKSMTDVDANSIWLLQNWMFVSSSSFWTPEKVKTFVTSVPLGKMLILDLQSEQWPQYYKYDMYYGQPFIWCMLHNFGGTLGLFGDTYSINNEVYDARNMTNSTMVGIGLTPEGINQNFVMYDLLLESSWRDKPVDLGSWVKKYTIRRYGCLNTNAVKAWGLLMGSVYNFTGLNKIRGKYVITRRPSLNLKPWSWYKSKDLIKAWEYLLSAQSTLNDSDGYRHDLVDLTRQILQYRGDQLYPYIVEAYTSRDLIKLTNYTEMFLELFSDLQSILSSHKNFLLGNWLGSAINIATTYKDKIIFEYNARNQITLWGPNGEIVDYANKQWAGMISDYYAVRWRLFLDVLKQCLINNVEMDAAETKLKIFNVVEQPFTFSNKKYPTNEIGDTIKIAQEIFHKWSSFDGPDDVPINFIPKEYFPGIKRFRREFHEIEEYDDDIEICLNPSVVLF